MSHVVISYTREDAGFADLLVTRFEAEGIPVWIDREGVGSGDWERKIEEAIQGARDFVLVVSPRSKNSSRVRDELHHARRWLEDEHIHPVILEEVPWMGIERLQQHDASEGDVPASLVRVLGVRSDEDAGTGPAGPAERSGHHRSSTEVVAPVSEGDGEGDATRGSRPVDGRWRERAFAETLDKGATSVAFTPDGSHVIAAGPGGDVGIWSVESGQLLEKKLMYASKASGVAVSCDGTRAAAAFAGGHVRLFRIPGLGHRKLRDPKMEHGGSPVVEFSRVRPHLAIGGAGPVKIWDWEAQRVLGTLERHTKPVHSISFDSSVDHLVTCDLDCAHVWDSRSHEHIRAIRPTVLPAAMAVSVDGTLVAFRTITGAVEVFDFERGELVARSNPSTDWVPVSALAFTPNGWLLSADSQGALRLWDPLTMAAVEDVGVHPGKAHAVVFSPVEQLVVSCARPKRWGFVGDEYPRFWSQRADAGDDRLAASRD